MRLLTVSRPAAVMALDELTDAGVLTKRRLDRGTSAYLAMDVFRLIRSAERQLVSTRGVPAARHRRALSRTCRATEELTSSAGQHLRRRALLREAGRSTLRQVASQPCKDPNELRQQQPSQRQRGFQSLDQPLGSVQRWQVGGTAQHCKGRPRHPAGHLAGSFPTPNVSNSPTSTVTGQSISWSLAHASTLLVSVLGKALSQAGARHLKGELSSLAGNSPLWRTPGPSATAACAQKPPRRRRCRPLSTPARRPVWLRRASPGPARESRFRLCR